MAIEVQSRIDPDPSSYSAGREYRQEHHFSHERGVVVLPLAARVPAHRKIRLHGGYGLRKVKWRTERVGSPPMIPAAVDTATDTILCETVVPHLPQPNAQHNGFNWVVEGEYVFVQNTPRVAGENAFPTGYYPFLVEPQSSSISAVFGSYARSLYSSITSDDVDKLELLTEYIFNRTSRKEDGTMFWPFTVHPAGMTSTHLIN